MSGWLFDFHVVTLGFSSVQLLCISCSSISLFEWLLMSAFCICLFAGMC